jgi:hypothetical protein
MGRSLKPFDVFICYKKSSGKDFAEHLKAGLEEMGIHSFLDSRDLPQKVDGKEKWSNTRDTALEESKTFILIITPGFDLSREVRKELKLARSLNKEFIYFRHRNLGRNIMVNLDTEKVDLGSQQQVSFETKEELLRLAHKILLKSLGSISPDVQQRDAVIAEKLEDKIKTRSRQTVTNNVGLRCLMCSKLIDGEPHIEVLNGKTCNFDSKECAKTYRKLKNLYGEYFE